MADEPRKRRPRAVANREGRIYRRSSDGRFVGVVWPPKEVGGKPVYVYGRTYKEAKDKRDAKAAELADAVPGAAGKDTTLARYMDHWLTVTLPQIVAAGNMSQGTLDSYADNARLHILPELGTITLRNLTGPRIRQWQHDLGAKPSSRPRRKLRRGEKALPLPPSLSVRTVTYCRAILHKALGDAIHDRVWGLKDNPVDLVRAPKKRSAEMQPPTPAEAAELMAAASNHERSCLWLVYLAVGLRRGEALGLRWADVDFERRTITVRQQIRRVREGTDPETGRMVTRLRPAGLKSERSERTVPVPSTAMAALEAHRRVQLSERVAAKVWLTKADLVFTTSVGTALEPRNVNREWVRVCQAAGTRPIRIHDLRHAWATYLLERGVDIKTVQAGLGHAHLSTTQVYLHTFEEMSREAADKMDAVLVDLRERGRRASRRRRPS